MRKVLVAYGTKRGATAEIAEAIGARLRKDGFAVDVRDVGAVRDVTGYDAVVVGSAIYMGRWLRPALRFLRRNRWDLRHRPVWLFQDGPLGEDRKGVEQPVSPKVAALAEQIGTFDIATFGGRLASDATGPLASRIAARYGGDYRDFTQIEGWSAEIARSLTPHAA